MKLSPVERARFGSGVATREAKGARMDVVLRRYLIVDDNVPFAENVAEIIADFSTGKAVVAGSAKQTRARRGDAVALVGAETTQLADLASGLRADGFPIARVDTLADAATLDLPLVATVVDFRLLDDAERASLLLLATALPQVPIFALDGQRWRTRPTQDPGIFKAWTDTPELLEELRRLSWLLEGQAPSAALGFPTGPGDGPKSGGTVKRRGGEPIHGEEHA